MIHLSICRYVSSPGLAHVQHLPYAVISIKMQQDHVAFSSDNGSSTLSFHLQQRHKVAMGAGIANRSQG